MKSVLKEFGNGVRATVTRKVWEWLLGGMTQSAFCEKYSLDKAMVSYGLSDGRLSFEVLVILLTEMKKDLPDLPKMPPTKVRAISGYVKALNIDMEDFCCLWSLHAHHSWFVYRDQLENPQITGRLRKRAETNVKELTGLIAVEAIDLYNQYRAIFPDDAPERNALRCCRVADYDTLRRTWGSRLRDVRSVVGRDSWMSRND